MGPLQFGRQALQLCLQARCAPRGCSEDVFDFERMGPGFLAQGVNVHGTERWVGKSVAIIAGRVRFWTCHFFLSIWRRLSCCW